jgi:hypothetical protein
MRFTARLKPCPDTCYRGGCWIVRDKENQMWCGQQYRSCTSQKAARF